MCGWFSFSVEEISSSEGAKADNAHINKIWRRRSLKSMAGNNIAGVVYPIRAQLSLNDWQRVSADKVSKNFSRIDRYTTIRLASQSTLSASLKSTNGKLKKI